MTSIFDAELKQTNPEFLNTFGTDVFVNGIRVKAIFESEAFDTESGRIYETSLMLDWDDVRHIQTNDLVEVDGVQYRVKRMPDRSTTDPLATVELKRA